MKHEKLAQALDEISDAHIAEAAAARRRRRPYWLGGAAAVLALTILVLTLTNPLAIHAKAVSTAAYPEAQWQYREEMFDITASLYDFFADSITQCLSGSSGENRAYSPVNLYMALCMTAELTGGSSREQILELLGSGGSEALRAQANKVWNACYHDWGHSTTVLASSVWLNEGLPYSQAVMDTLSGNYYASVYQGALGSEKINRDIAVWLNQQTGGLLKKETGQVSLSPETLLALYSTVYYRAKWTEHYEFSSKANTAGIFHSPSGELSCTFMNRKELQTDYYWGSDYGAVALGLKDGSRMWFLLPDEGKRVEDILSGGEYAQMLLSSAPYSEGWENSKYMRVNLSLPKFDITSRSDLKQDLQVLGVTDVFDPEAADFSASIPGASCPVWLANVNQATRVAVDEEGVTAASYIELPAAGAAQPPDEVIDFILDRPFLFVITNSYGIPLFAGVVNEP